MAIVEPHLYQMVNLAVTNLATILRLAEPFVYNYCYNSEPRLVLIEQIHCTYYKNFPVRCSTYIFLSLTAPISNLLKPFCLQLV